MAASYPGSIKSFTTKVDAVDDVLAAHVNDLQNEVVAVETALGVNFGRGTSFPVSGLAAGQLYFRTDLGWLCYYDGARWLTVHEFSAGLNNVGLTYASTGSVYFLQQLRQDYAVYITRWVVRTSVATTNDGSNYWTCILRGVNALASAATTVDQFTTAADTVATLTEHDRARGSFSGTNPPTEKSYLDIVLNETGAPGDITVYPTVYYRLIVT